MSLALPLLLLFASLGPARAQDQGEDDEQTPGVFDEPLAPVAEQAPYEPHLHAYIAAAVGPSLPLGPIGIGTAARLDSGVELPVLGGRLMPFFTAGVAAPQARGTIQDDALPEGKELNWSMTTRQLQLGLGVHARLLDRGAPFSPELSLAPQLVLVDARMVSAIGEGIPSTVHENSKALGWLAALGMAARSGPGEAFVRVEATGVPLEGVLAGDVSGRSIAPMVGYRMDL